MSCIHNPDDTTYFILDGDPVHYGIVSTNHHMDSARDDLYLQTFTDEDKFINALLILGIDYGREEDLDGQRL